MPDKLTAGTTFWHEQPYGRRRACFCCLTFFSDSFSVFLFGLLHLPVVRPGAAHDHSLGPCHIVRSAELDRPSLLRRGNNHAKVAEQT